MPWILAAAAVTAGSALLGANAADNAASKAADAQSTASAAALAAQQQNLSNITNLQQPFITAGTTAIPALENHIAGGVPNFGLPTYTTVPGVQPPGTTAPATNTIGATGGVTPAPVGNANPSPAGAPATGAPATAAGGPAGASGGLIDGQPASVWDAYLAANPDVAAWAAAGHGDPNGGPNQTPEQAAAYHYTNGGQAEGRTITPAPATDPNATPAPTTQVPVDMGTASGVVPTYTRPTQGVAPSASDFINPANFTTSPGYQFRLDQGLRNTNASFGAKGLLQSGAALQGFNDYAQNSASAEYQNWFNQQQQLYQDAQGRYQFGTNNANQNFNDDRSYGTNLGLVNQANQTNAFNTNTDNLFRLAGIGTGATNALSAASTNTANNSSNIAIGQGNNAAQNALAVGNTNAQLYGTLGSTVSNLFSSPSRFSGGTPLTLQTSGANPYGGNLNPVNAFNPNTPITSGVPTY